MISAVFVQLNACVYIPQFGSTPNAVKSSSQLTVSQSTPISTVLKFFTMSEQSAMSDTPLGAGTNGSKSPIVNSDAELDRYLSIFNITTRLLKFFTDTFGVLS